MFYLVLHVPGRGQELCAKPWAKCILLAGQQFTQSSFIAVLKRKCPQLHRIPAVCPHEVNCQQQEQLGKREWGVERDWVQAHGHTRVHAHTNSPTHTDTQTHRHTHKLPDTDTQTHRHTHTAPYRGSGKTPCPGSARGPARCLSRARGSLARNAALPRLCRAQQQTPTTSQRTRRRS